MDALTTDFVRAGILEELKAKGRLVMRSTIAALIWSFRWIAAAS